MADNKTAYGDKDYPVHTNGPWGRDDFALSSDIIAIGQKCVATVHSRHCFTPEEMRANAKLIAAAPEMLEVLRWLDNEMDCRDDEFGGCLFSRVDFDRVRTVIKSAMEGQAAPTDEQRSSKIDPIATVVKEGK